MLSHQDLSGIGVNCSETPSGLSQAYNNWRDLAKHGFDFGADFALNSAVRVGELIGRALSLIPYGVAERFDEHLAPLDNDLVGLPEEPDLAA